MLKEPVPEQLVQGSRPLQPLALPRGALPVRVQLSAVPKVPIGSVFELQAEKPQNGGRAKALTLVPEECALQVPGAVSAVQHLALLPLETAPRGPESEAVRPVAEQPERQPRQQRLRAEKQPELQRLRAVLQDLQVE